MSSINNVNPDNTSITQNINSIANTAEHICDSSSHGETQNAFNTLATKAKDFSDFSLNLSLDKSKEPTLQLFNILEIEKMKDQTNNNANEAQETTNTNNLPSIKGTFSLTNLKESLATQGFNGIEIDFSSFPTVVQKGSQFSINGDSSFCDQVMYIKLINSQNKFVLTDQADKDSDFIKYSYDGIVTVDGENIDDLKVAMLEAGKDPVLRRNLEVFCQLVNRNDKYNNRLVFVSISATSASRASGFLTELALINSVCNVFSL